MRPFPLESVGYDFMGCSVDTFILLPKPPPEVFVGRFKTDKPVTPPEAFTYEIMRPFYFSLYPSGIGWGNFGLEPVMQGKSHEGVIEFVFTRDLADEYVLHPVV